MDRPNIIVIITDQQRYDTIGALGYPYMETPNLDRLVTEGVSFTQCHVTAPSCAPSRASLFTGTYPHTTGILKNADTWRHSWVETLAEAGYHCVNIGKMYTWPMDTPMGFHERYVVENKDRYLEARYFFDEWDKALKARGLVKQQRELYRKRSDYNERWGAFEWELPEDMHSDMFVGDTAVWWLKNKPRPRQPLFLQIGFPGPHPPYDPINRYASPYLNRELPLPRVTVDDLADQPAPLKALREHNMKFDHDSVVHLPNPSREQYQRLWAYYLANITMIDEKIGLVLKALEEQGYLENSVVIFTSDHGEALGEHGHIQKWTCYDCVTRVPLIVWAPGRFSGGRRIEGLCQHMDIAPVILELANLPAPAWMEAETLLPALRGGIFKGRTFVISEHGRDSILDATDFMTMVRTHSWKLVHFLGHEDGQLFNLEADPSEERNFWRDPSQAGKKRELLDTIREFRIRSSYRTSNFWQEVR